jgi:chromosome partitioning protein
MERCSSCGREFTPEFVYQIATVKGQKLWFCTLDCRGATLGQDGFRPRRSRRIAVLNQKGGTGKTTTALNLAAGVAERGFEVLLVDFDAQGNVGASLGIRGEKSLYHVLVEGLPPDEAAVPVRGHLDVITSDATLAAAETWLARRDDRDRSRVLCDRMQGCDRRYHYVVLDCAPSLSLLNQNALTFADEVVIPVACDYLGLVGVKQVMRTLSDVNRILGHAVQIAGVVPTFYDGRTRLAREAHESLKHHFKDRCLDPIRRSTRLAEAPSHKQTIFEYAPDSPGADDYRRLIEQLLLGQPAAPWPMAPGPGGGMSKDAAGAAAPA